MNINLFFILIIALLSSIYLFFKPLALTQREFVEIPLVELNNFTLYELDNNDLKILLSAKVAKRYSDRYEIKNINYTDNKDKYLVNIQADSAIYKDDYIDLDGNIIFNREDGLMFKTQKAQYSRKDDLVTTDGLFSANIDDGNMTGYNLKYNNKLNIVESKNIEMVYKFKD